MATKNSVTTVHIPLVLSVKNSKGAEYVLDARHVSHTGGFMPLDGETEAETVAAREVYRRVCEIADAAMRRNGAVSKGKAAVTRASVSVTKGGRITMRSTLVTDRDCDPAVQLANARKGAAIRKAVTDGAVTVTEVSRGKVAYSVRVTKVVVPAVAVVA